MKRIFVGLTGASGHRYADALLRELLRSGIGVDLAVTGAGCLVLRHELGVEAGERGELLAAALPGWLGPEAQRLVRVHLTDEVGAPPASGSAGGLGAILIPCSMGTLARVAAGFSSNLVERVADVALKEGRPLLLVPRETPLSEVHLENMLRLARMGAILLPAMPGWYHRPKDLDELVAHLVAKILDRLGLQQRVVAPYAGLEDKQGAEPPPEAGVEPPT